MVSTESVAAQRASREGTCLLIDSESADESASASMLADTCADEIDLQRQLARALSLLPPTHAAVLLAQGQEGLSYDEAAETLGLSVHTVKKYIAQARAALRSAAQD